MMEFCEVTHVDDREVAVAYLSAADWNCQQAVLAYFDDPSNAGAGADAHGPHGPSPVAAPPAYHTLVPSVPSPVGPHDSHVSRPDAPSPLPPGTVLRPPPHAAAAPPHPGAAAAAAGPAVGYPELPKRQHAQPQPQPQPQDSHADISLPMPNRSPLTRAEADAHPSLAALPSPLANSAISVSLARSMPPFSFASPSVMERDVPRLFAAYMSKLWFVPSDFEASMTLGRPGQGNCFFFLFFLYFFSFFSLFFSLFFFSFLFL